MCNATATDAAAAAAGSKADAYGKVKVFKESKLSQLMHVSEVAAAITLVLFHRPPPLQSSQYVRDNFDLKLVEFIDDMVMKNDVIHVSSLLLRMLPGPVLVDAQCLSQTLRALDCIEDEPVFYGDDLEKKIAAMLEFCQNALKDPNWMLEGVGESPPERELMKSFPKIHKLVKSLRPESQKVVQDVTDIMAKGMIDFLRTDLSQGPATKKEYEDYCYAISGSVGEGLSIMWAASGLENKSLATETHLAHRMGNFAIKPTMIFTFMEDVVDKRVKWPKEIWGPYSKTGELSYFFQQDDPEVQVKSLQCLNAIVNDAIAMVPDALKYLEQLQCLENFRWVATIIVATAAQLEMCYANPKIFQGCVFIRHGIICKLILKTNSLEQVQYSVHTIAANILKKAEQMDPKVQDDPSYQETLRACREIMKVTAKGAAVERSNRQFRAMLSLGLVVLAGFSAWFLGKQEDADANLSMLVSTVLVVAASVVYFLLPSSTASTAQPLQKCGLA